MRAPRAQTVKGAMFDPRYIRNFSIIAHIDHGKSTLADRLIQHLGGLSDREMQEQVLDSMELERERGITIKAQTVRLLYTARDGHQYMLNLMDTPGHVDFSYEVSRSLVACEGSLLVVDASQGVEAQTLANVYLALDADNELIPVLNKVDLPAAEPERIKTEIEEVVGIEAQDALEISAKTGKGVEELLETIIQRLPAPESEPEAPLKALLVDSWYDPYLGVVILVRVYNGTLKTGQKLRFMQTGADHALDRVGIMTPKPVLTGELGPGQIGFITAGIKDIDQAQVGDTITEAKRPTEAALPGFKPSVPVVFCGLFPADQGDYARLRDSMAKLRLNDSSFHYEPQVSEALGFGFRCGFLGMLHMEIIQARLEREFDIELVMTAPSVVYKVYQHDGEMLEVHNPADLPDMQKIARMEEPWIVATILVPDDFVGGVIQLCSERRGIQRTLTYAGNRAWLEYELPLNEVVFEFYDRLKSITRGYASFDYYIAGYRESDLVKLQIFVNKEPVDALAAIVHRDQADYRGRQLCERLKDLIPRQMFKVPIQAAVGNRVIARETVPAVKKDVLAKCYGGDVSRKRKLLEKQKAGKKKMRQVGKVEIPQNAFIDALKMKDDG